MGSAVAAREFRSMLERVFDALDRGDYEEADRVMDEWLDFVGCLDVWLGRLCKRICRGRAIPPCACMSEESYYELVGYAIALCKARG